MDASTFIQRAVARFTTFDKTIGIMDATSGIITNGMLCLSHSACKNRESDSASCDGVSYGSIETVYAGMCALLGASTIYEKCTATSVRERIAVGFANQAAIYVVSNDIAIYVDSAIAESLGVKQHFAELVKSIKRPKAKRRDSIYILSVQYNSLTFVPFSIKKVDVSVSDNYTDEFQQVHDVMIDRLNMKNDKGIAVLYGSPGTGKTNYIRHLIANLKKKVLYIPPQMVSYLTDPALIPVLTRFGDSVIVIEDADNLLRNRESTSLASTSTILNYADGLLNDVFNIQIVCTFNMKITDIDPAILRSGRLIAQHEFAALPAEKATALSAKLGLDVKYDSPTLLCDVYNAGSPKLPGQKQRHKIGFKK